MCAETQYLSHAITNVNALRTYGEHHGNDVPTNRPEQMQGEDQEAMAQSRITQDHEEIRQWAEVRGGKPAQVTGTSADNEAGLLRFEFPGSPQASDDNLQELSWEVFFEKFDASGLSLLYEDLTTEGVRTNFNKLVHAEPDEKPARTTATGKKSAGTTSPRKTAAKRNTAKKAATKKAAAKKVPARKTAAKKTAVKKAAAKKVSAKKAPAKKTSVKKAPARKQRRKKQQL